MKEPIQIIEIDQPLCSLEYGVSPCAAALGTTGEIKCFNTARTCQDLPNYSPETLTLRFAKSQSSLPPDIHIIPSVLSVSTSPTEVNVVGSKKSRSPLGVRAGLRVTFQDHPYADTLVDKYRDERSYIATERGTFWTKWLARNPYYNNSIIRVRDGYVGQALEDMVTRTYIIETVSPPDSRGRVTLEAKDVLKLADNERAQAPAASPGELIVDVNDTTTADLRVTRAIASDYPAPGTVRINDEVLTYTGVTTISSTEIRLTGITRSTDGTEADDHDSGDRVQLCLRYENVRPDALAYEWLTEYGYVPASFIPLADWQAEAEIWLLQFELSGLITEPTGVTDLLGEITEQALFYTWWDERDQEIKLKALRPAYTDPVTTLNGDQNVIADSTSVIAKPKERYSQVWVFFGQRDPTEKLDKETNYRRARIRADLEAESDDQYGEQRIKKIYSRWLVTDGQAIQAAVRLLARFRDTPEYLTVQLDAKDRALWTADLADVTLDNIVDDTGLAVAKRWQVLSAEESSPGEVVEYTLQRFEYGLNARFAYWMPSDAPDFADADEAELIIGAYWSDENGEMPNGTEGYLWQ